MTHGYKGVGLPATGSDETNPFVERMNVGQKRAGYIRAVRPLTKEQSSRLQAEWRRHWARPAPSALDAETTIGFDTSLLLVFVLGIITGIAGTIAIMAFLGYL